MSDRMGNTVDYIQDYIDLCRDVLRNPNSNFTLEARNAGKAFLDAWEAYRVLADEEMEFYSHSNLYYLLTLPWHKKARLRAEEAKKRVDQAQGLWHKLTAK